ncbi:MAG: sulfatase family protein [Planctomycetota bacterium]
MSTPRISRRQFLAGSLVGCTTLQTWMHAKSVRPRNVLFIMTDQHNAHALGCYGSREVQTPNMDRLAREGALFEQAFCQTGQCCPARYSIWTGRYARTHGLYYNGQLENPKEDTVGDILRRQGYRTATIGKHHMNMAAVPDKHGFDVVVDIPEYRKFLQSKGKTGQDSKGDFLPEHVRPGRSRVGASRVDNDHHKAGYWATRAIDFMRESKDRPFCLWLSFYGPHTPITPAEPWASMYDPARVTLPPNHKYDYDYNTPGLKGTQTKSGTFSEDLHRRTLAYYYGLVSQIDHNIGRVLDELERLGLAHNTAVVYTADHGEMMSEHGAWTKGRQGYDATVRVPLILRCPGVIPPGVRRKEPACSIDLLPTLLELTHQPIPENVQGKSLVAPARGQSRDWRDTIFSEIGASLENQTVIARTTNTKYVVYRQDGKAAYEQLFDLEKDPWEMQNQIGNPKYKRALIAMREKLARWEGQTKTIPPCKRVPRKTAQRNRTPA